MSWPLRGLRLITVSLAVGTVLLTAPKATANTSAVTHLAMTGAASSSRTLVKFYVQPDTDAAKAVVSLEASGDTADAALINKIATRPQAIWLGEWDANLQITVSQVLAAAHSQVPVFVLYAIPDRDCGGFSEGGYKSAAEYKKFVTQIADGTRGHAAWFIVEPDALPDANSCLTKSQQLARIALINFASKTLSTVSSHVYLDAGNYNWQTAPYMAAVLKAAGVSYDAGFSLDVSAYNPTALEESYGNQLSKLIGGKHFVIDTSRNGGTVRATTWCNAQHQHLGVVPTTTTNDRLVDAYLWIKSPGQSDGSCGNGAPPSGDWWLSYALGLAKN